MPEGETSDDDASSESWERQTITGDDVELRRLVEPRVYLVIFEGESSRMVPVASEGTLVLGRTDVADIKISHESVSRKHAQLTITGGHGVITDLGSQNGTKVNGERITGARPLLSGDFVTLGSINASYQSSARHVPRREVLGLAELVQRADQEIERALRFARPISVLAINLELGGKGDRVMLPRSLEPTLRPIDVIAWGGSDQLVLLLPELDVEAATRVAERILAVLATRAPLSRIGIATAPADGCDCDTVIASARAATLAAESQKIVSASEARSTRTVGDRTLVMADPVMSRLYALVERLAMADLAVLVCGETGTGKELAATALHHWSPRKSRPLISLNCAAIAESLVESELFGHEKGAFSGATASRAGLLETADGGTVFLDEIGELSLSVQAKLLRVLETKRITRIGDVREREVDIRIVAATNRNLEEEVTKGRFRQDLFFRLSGATLWLPPLRDRKRELPLLAQMFLDDSCKVLDRSRLELSAGAIQTLSSYPWPGNVRELKNVMDYLAATVFDDDVSAEHVGDRLRANVSSMVTGAPPPPSVPASVGRPSEDHVEETTGVLEISRTFRPLEEELRELERRRIEEALEAARGNQTRAAELISMPLRTFMNKVKLHNLSPRKR